MGWQHVATGWTDERVEQLRKLWLGGLSAAQIAKQIGGVSRNAVIGKGLRLGLPPRGKQVASQPQSFAKAQPKERKVSLAPTPLEVAPPLPVAPAPAPACQANGSGPRLRDLDWCHCRWPIGVVPVGYGDEQLFCGKGFPNDDRRVPYCDAHKAESIQASQPKPPRPFEPDVIQRRPGRDAPAKAFGGMAW